jgi:hypothetical protein
MRRTRRISWAPSGWPVVVTTTGVDTDTLTVTCGDDFAAVRVGFTNITTGHYHISRVIASASDTLGDFINPTGGTEWRCLTFANGGAGEERIVASNDAPREITVRGLGSPPINEHTAVPRWTWTDWIPLSSMPRRDIPNGPRVVMFRVLFPAGCTNTRI